MNVRRLLFTLACFSPGFILPPHALAGDIVIVAHPSVPRLDRQTVLRIYTGKVVELDGLRVCPIDLPAGNPVRARFLIRWVNKDEGNYVAYWTVRRYVGKGSPPAVAHSIAEMQSMIAERPGCIGYADEAELKPGSYVVAR